MSFLASIKLGSTKKVPLIHTGFKGCSLTKGTSFKTTNTEEALYYRAQPGFSVTVLKGRLPSPVERVEPEEHDEEELDESGEDEAEDDGGEEEVEGDVKSAYERRDLKKMHRDDLLALVKDDEDLPLTVKEIPKKASKKEIINLILDAQKSGAEED